MVGTVNEDKERGSDRRGKMFMYEEALNWAPACGRSRMEAWKHLTVTSRLPVLTTYLGTVDCTPRPLSEACTCTE